MKPRRLAGLVSILGMGTLFALAGCGSDDDEAKTPAASCKSTGPLLTADCDPIGGHCGFPFPLNVYLKDDPTGKNPSGKSIRFGAATLPKVNGMTPIGPALFYGLDGFSPASAPATYLPNASATGLPTPRQIATTVDAASPTIILNADTGELVPHWADIDQQAAAPEQRAIILHPAVLLKNRGRYIVAMRRVVDASGAAIAPTVAFQALRDGSQSSDPDVESRRCLYQDIFAKLAKAGVNKHDLQIAWDFTVGSRESITNPPVKVRDAALARSARTAPSMRSSSTPTARR